MTISVKIPRIFEKIPPKWLFMALFAMILIVPHSCNTNCHFSCATCSNPSPNGCLSCVGTRYYLASNHSCIGNCPDGQYADVDTHTCKPCHSDCLTCVNGSNQGCLLCPSNRVLILSNHSCASTCPSGSYSSGTLCTACHPSCATCSNSSANGCLTCPRFKWYLPSNHSCVDTCPSGYTGDFGTKTCVEITCHPSCATCSNSSANGCLTCPRFKWYIPSNHSCVDRCPSGYTADFATKTCVVITCHPSCTTCSNSSETGCLTCPPNKYLIPTNHTCVSSCPPGWYANENVCDACHSSCATCNNDTATGCLTCPRFKWYLPSNHSCVDRCPSGYTGDFATKTCVLIPCHPSCATCSNSSANGCLTCPRFKWYIPSNHSCVDRCPSGYTGDFATKTCVIIPCHPSCATCSNSSETGCLTCPPNKYFIPSNHTCVSSCPPGWYANENVCEACHSSCATCSNSSANGCLTCPRFKWYIPSNHSCVDRCPSGYTADFATKTCIIIICHPSCATCSNSSATGCLTCPPNRYYIPSNHTCVRNCPPAWYASDKVCVACHSSCATCSNASADGCLTCPPNKWLIPSNHSCVDNCPSGYTEDDATKTCVVITCHPSCATCNNSSVTGCLTCPPNRYFIPSNRTCVRNCPRGWYANGTLCVPCHPSCATCSNSSANGCLTCKQNWYLIPFNHSCVKNCPPKWYASSNVCLACHSSCATCSNSSATGCLTCPPNRYFIPTNHTCVKNCPSAWYASNNVCVACHPSCSSCSGSGLDQCNTCASSYPIQCGGYCQVQCPGRWIRNQWICYQCDASCNGCVLGARNCLKCARGYTRTNPSEPCIPKSPSRLIRLRD